MPRVFFPWNSTTHSWCGEKADYDEYTLAGLIYNKVHKAASSTLAGVTLRVAKNYGSRYRRTLNGEAGSECASFHKHTFLREIRRFHDRNRARSFMFSSIRHPAHRALSWIFYMGSNRGEGMDEEFVLRELTNRAYYPQRVKGAGAQATYMYTDLPPPSPLWSLEEPTKVQDLRLSIQRVADILKTYDYIMIVERLHESLVVLQLLLGLATSDILYVSAKRSGQYAFKKGRFPGCHLIAKSYISPAIAAYFSSPQWYAQNYEDYLLYKAANRSLDLTIDNLGRRRFEEALAKYNKMMQDAEVCENETVTPCTSEGVRVNKTDCYDSDLYDDLGCGYACLDRLFVTQ
ncbi:sulfotransferase family [Fragilaria crotonensis]|nr:sulfotransferase family [Fragilaria crotonensis]